jgi:sugar O-acyltransferase (sialic acid O-acetyltransferase NeuD family)
MTTLAIIGASGLAREALAVVREARELLPIGVFDDAASGLGSTFSGLPVLGEIDQVETVRADLYLVCVGAGLARERIVERLRMRGVLENRYATVVDPSVRNPAGCPIGAGSILLSHVSITADVIVGEHVAVMPGVTITHDDVIERYATLAAGVTLGGSVRVCRGAYLGMNAAVFPGVRIGAGAVIGMSAAVLRNVPAGETWAGVPARELSIADRLFERTS